MTGDYPILFGLPVAEFGCEFLHTDQQWCGLLPLMGFCPYHQTCSDLGSGVGWPKVSDIGPPDLGAACGKDFTETYSNRAYILLKLLWR